MKLGIADYGMNAWDGGCFDYEERWARLKEIGCEGMERLHARDRGSGFRAQVVGGR